MTEPDLRETVTLALKYARAGERLAATIGSFKPVVESIQGCSDLAPELAPELTVALDHIQKSVEALERAFMFATFQFDVSIGIDLQTEGDSQ